MQNDLIKELGTNFIEYAAAVNSDRSIPSATSGLKPVALRILYDMYINGNLSSKAYVKCARTYGDVMGKFHPHGDSSIYGAMVRLAQWWIMRYPLIDFHGNMGNIDGDGPAAGRYTEARLAKITEDGLIKGIKKRSVDFIPNYDNTLEEPITLPAIFPNLLCNPNSGIGVAIACNWLPHNLVEVANAICDFMEGKEPSIPGPDFPTGGIIINAKELPAIINRGRGTVKVRGKYNIEKNNCIVFYEIPYGTNTESLMTQAGKYSDDNEDSGIIDIRNESNKKGMRIVIEVKKGINPESVVKKLFINTDFQTSISYNQVALVGKTPTELGLKDCIKIYLEHNEECISREVTFDLEKALARQEIVDGLLKALEDIDNIISLIKESKSSKDAKIALINKYSFSENQASAIVNMKLGSLAGLEKIELQNEKKDLINQIEDYNNILSSQSRRFEIIKERLTELVKKYGDARRTELLNIEVPKEEKEIAEVIPEDVVVVLTKTGLIKRVPAKSFKVQKRNGVGIKNADSAILSSISTNTVDILMAFSSKGKMYRLVVDNVPAGTNVSKGSSIRDLIPIEPDEEIIAITSLYRKSEAKYVVFITKNGLLKKTELNEYKSAKRNCGIAAIKLKEGDSLANVTFLNDEQIMIITKKGMSIRFETKDIGAVGRIAMGVKSIKLDEGDSVLCGLPVHKDTDNLAIFTEKGLGKKMELSEFPVQGRSGKGLQLYKGDNIVGAEMISDNDSILIVGNRSTICISAKDIPNLGRTAAGNIMIKNSTILNVVKI